MAQAHLRLILDAGNETNASSILKRFRKLVEAEIISLEPYHKGGFEANINLLLPSGDWSQQVIHAITAAQTFGRAWTLTGDISDTIDITSNEFSMSGLKFAQLIVMSNH